MGKELTHFTHERSETLSKTLHLQRQEVIFSQGLLNENMLLS